MAKAIYPIVELGRHGGLPLELEDIFEGLNFKRDDQFTYTVRYDVPEEDRGRVEAEVRKRLDPESAERFLRLINKYDWDVSFLVDTY